MTAAVMLARPSGVSSAAGVLALLEEQENSLRVAALERLNTVVDEFWHEIADYISDIESLYEEAAFPGKELAALVASKVYYHLEEYSESLRFALGAGQLFDLSQHSEYIEKVVAVALDEYIQARTSNFEQELKGQELEPLDPRLEDIVNRMFKRCTEEKAYKLGLGMALETRRLDMMKTFITAGSDVSGMLDYAQTCAMTLLTSKAFRERVLRTLVEIYTSTKDVNYAALCQCYFVLNEPAEISKIMKELLGRSDKRSVLLAYQIAFDIVDNENQHFCNVLLSSSLLAIAEPQQAAAAAPAEGAEAPAVEAAPPAESPMQVESTAGGETMTEEAKENLAQLRSILSGRSSIDLHLEFLYRNNRSDLLLLETVKNSVDSKNSILHNGTVMAHSLMQCGTTSDVFLRKNLEWLAKATNWAKFSATASLGVIHKGHIKDTKSILSTYLPQGGGANRGSPYSEGGALYAMGIIHANHYDAETKNYLVEQLHDAQSAEVLAHGACLGLGLVSMATADEAIYEELKQTLYTDTAVAGEAAAYAIGLVMVGSASERVIGELLAYAHDTQHEKIIRGCALALAMTMFRREEEAESLIQQMLLDKDPILRYGACFCIGLAYVGSSKNDAIKRLLHISVSDVSDDVRRGAVISLGFVMCNAPEQLPGVVKLLSESYNPHVRYAAAMALGIACAGSAQLDAHNLLDPLMSDGTDFVRQGATIAMGMLYMQTAPGKTERVKTFRAKNLKTIADKHEDVMTRFGAILANGIMDAGGRNVSASFFSNSGVLRPGAAIGFCLFTQMWYWFPLIHMFSLVLTPNALIGLTEKLKIPKNFQVKSGARPSLFGYPEPMQPPKKEEQVKVATAVLSTAAKAKALEEKKQKESEQKKETASDAHMDDKAEAASRAGDGASVAGTAVSVAATLGTTVVGSVAGDSIAARSDVGSESMEVDETAAGVTSAAAGAAAPEAAAEESSSKRARTEAETPGQGESDVKADAEGDDKKGGEAKTEDKPEPLEEILSNPCRVLKAQQQFISFPAEIEAQPARYTPVLRGRRRVGFLLLEDNRPEEAEDLFLEDDKKEEDEKEPEPPQPFDFTEADIAAM